MDNEKGDSSTLTWYSRFELDIMTNSEKIVLSSYFAITTLSTVGYGDFYPIHKIEMVFAVLVMLGGVAFFSFIMGTLVEIIENYRKKTSILDKKPMLNYWLTSLQRFMNNQPLPKYLYEQLEADFNFFWANDRISTIDFEDDEVK